jgi:hypothetical protein
MRFQSWVVKLQSIKRWVMVSEAARQRGNERGPGCPV